MKDYFFLAFNNLKRRRLRSWLTMIGIFIGIAAVVALISLGQGLQNYIEGEFESLGGDKINIEPNVFAPPGSVSDEKLILTSDDLDTIRNVRGVDIASGLLIKTSIMEFKGETHIGLVIGYDEYYEEIFGDALEERILEGQSLKENEKTKVMVGYNHAYGDIWDSPMRLRDKIEFEGQEFKVAGIFTTQHNPYDDGALLMRKEVLRDLLKVYEEESTITVKVKEGFNPEEVAENIKRKLRQSRNEKEGQETFKVETYEQILESFQNIFSVVQGVLVGIAGISLIVGGLGIMNTMYTSVIERTKEIGTMKAVGAKNSDVLLIFLFESGLLGLVGGAIGVLIGMGLGKGAEYLGKVAIGTDLLQASFSLSLIFGALAFSFFIGTLSGIFPALQASKLKPAIALRYE